MEKKKHTKKPNQPTQLGQCQAALPTHKPIHSTLTAMEQCLRPTLLVQLPLMQANYSVTQDT